MTDSLLETRLSHHLDLTFAERDALRWLERRERSYAAGDIIFREGDRIENLYIVGSGWLHSSVTLRDGDRQILRFYFIGDITTTLSVAWQHSAATFQAVSDTTLFEIPKEVFGDLFRKHPRLGALMFAISASEQVSLGDRLTSISKTDGFTRIATLLLDLRSRLRVVDDLPSSSFELPLTQKDIGDAVGLTKTHVNRSLKSLEATGLVERDGRVLRITDVDRLAALVDFRDRHAVIATDWLPPVGATGAAVLEKVT